MKTLATLLGAAALALAGCAGGKSGDSPPTHVNITFRNRVGTQYSLGLIKHSGYVAVIDASLNESPLGFTEVQYHRAGESLVLTDAQTENTQVLALRTVNTTNRFIELTDYATGGVQASYDPASKEGDLVRSGIAYHFTVNEGAAAVRFDKNANGAFGNNEVPLVGVSPSGALTRWYQRDLVQ
ncbi:MAG TPA: hypothetical protein VJJ82_03110 [Candidatus Nanoarchaeia archaeon]|nr:hypothetical protein [Candidatus Nanoarchaeia archaeon]